jgi:serine/threonine-protein kinase
VDARNELTDVGLAVGKEEPRPDPTVPKDAVISSNPPAGTVVDKGQAIDLVISSGPEMVVVPDVVGSSEASAVVALQDAGFQVDPLYTREFNSKYKAGIVFNTDPPVRSEAPKGAKVHLWISKGTEMVAVPFVGDLTQADATTDLNAAGFTVKVVPKADSVVAKGSVIDQKPAGGGQAAKGGQVVIYVSTGPEQVTVTNLVGLTQAQAVAKLDAMGLKNSIMMVNNTDPATTAKVQNQDPPTGTPVNKGATVTIWVAQLP